jgi:5'-nucleotidase/UDP-sugar diphosphatase
MRFKWILGLCAAILALLPAVGVPAQGTTTTVTLLHFSDYHSHAVPFYSEGQPNQGGIARAIAYLKAQRAANPNLLILSGGDTMNKGTPTWSDEYTCVEWPWFNGLVDAMALGNHDFDYGQDLFNACKAKITYPIISANYVGTDGVPLLEADGKPYIVKTVAGVKIGLFAVAGSDFNSLVTVPTRAPGATFSDRIAAAKSIVDTLRNVEKVDAVVLFGHELREDDTALAQAVPGIDLILGTHSHYKGELTTLPGTNTSFISPFQYLTYISQVQLTFSGGKLTGVTGHLVKMDQSQPEDAALAAQVTQMQKDLVAKHPDRFQVLGTAAVEFSDANLSTDESVLGNWAMDVLRQEAGTHAFFSTASSFRAAIPPGPITVEAFYTAIPYKNSIVTADLTGQQLADLINLALSKRGSDGFSQMSGVRFAVVNGAATDIQVLNDPANANSGYSALDLTKTYKVGTTNYQALIAGGYKDIFAKAANVVDTKRDVSTLLIAKIQAQGTITGALDNRMSAATPVVAPGMPTTGTADLTGLAALLALALSLVAGGGLLRRRPARG